jgi:Ankyrin repeats (3 copies)
MHAMPFGKLHVSIIIQQCSYRKGEFSSLMFIFYAAIVQELLKYDAALSKTIGPSKVTPLMSASMRGHPEIVKLLLEHNSGLFDISKDNKKNALHFAARQGHIDVVQILLGKDPQLARRTDKKGQTALHMAVKGTNCNTVKVLVDVDPAIVMLPDKNGNTALHVATRKKRAEVIVLNLFCYPCYIPCMICIAGITKHGLVEKEKKMTHKITM